MAERRNRTLIEAARTMLADFKLPTTFWAEAVSTACYVQNRVLLVKPHNKTPYELFIGLKPALNFMRPFGCHVTILNTLDNLGKFDGKSEEGKISNESADTQGELNVGTYTQKEEISQDCIVMPIWKDASYFDSLSKDVGNGEPNPAANDQKQVEDGPHNKTDEKDKSKDDSSSKEANVAGQHVNTASPEVNIGRFKLNIVDPSVDIASSYELDSPKDMFKLGASHTLETTHVEFFSDEDEPEVDLGNITNSYTVPTTPNTRIHKDHTIKNVIEDVKSSIQTRRITKSTSKQGFLSVEELLQFKLQQVWKLVDLPNRKRAIGTKWVYRNKKDERGIMIRNKARLVAHGHRQEEGIYYGEVFAPVAGIEAIRLFLVYASFMGFLVVKALYGLHQAPRACYETFANYLLGNRFKRRKIDQTLFIKKQKGDILLVQVYVDDIIFGSTNKELCTAFEKLMKDKFQISSIGELTFFLGLQSTSTLIHLEKPLVKDGGLQVTQKEDGIFISQDKWSLMYLTASRPDIIYLKGKPTLGLWYSRDSPFELVAYTNSDYAGATQDMKSTTGGCQFLGNRLISWQCKKQTMVATSTTEAKYVAAASCYLLTNGFDAGRHVKRGRDTKIPQSSGPPVKVGDKVAHKELGDRMERAANTAASSLEAEQDSVTARTTDDGEVEIIASIDGQVKTITEASLRRHLKLEDYDGITSLPNTDIFNQLALMGTFNFSKMIFDAMVKNLDSTHKFLMYPRFLQICLNKQKRLLQPHTRTYPTPTLTQKLFSNMKRVSKGYSGVDFPLFPTMITTPESSPSRITSSPSLSPQTYQSPQSSPLRDITRQDAEIPQSQFPTQTQVADEAAFTSVDVDAGGAATTDIGLDRQLRFHISLIVYPTSNPK
ncbi:putative ribonuclease H-like domain-containing protein [Tanacetum coccineum]|uniref:peroxidase n=1 Tax=Tanacetum coccineum TaxID=301880 RepID=A0ABQ4XCN3_9ASTR